jgi:hypothetical protein
MRLPHVGLIGPVVGVVLLLLTAAPVWAQSTADRFDGFETDQPGRPPARWSLGCTAASRTTAEVTRSHPASGRQCVRLVKRGAEDFGNLVQSVEVGPYLNKRIRFRAAVRTQPAAPESCAQLWMRIDCPEGRCGFFDNMADRPIRTARWAAYEIIADVPEDAEKLLVGVIVNGPGQVWLDDVSLAVLGAARAPGAWTSRLVHGTAVVAVKDFMRLENAGDAIDSLQFPRYFPIIDDEQFVLGRWVEARTDAGRPVAISIAKVEADGHGNLIHTYEISRFPAETGVVVSVTSLVLRRERAAPEREFRIPRAGEYPAEVRPFLGSTANIVVDHPDIRNKARELRAKTDDAWQVAGAVAALMRENTYKQRGMPDPSLPTSARVLEHGGSCCGSAVCAAALLRACGIPAQITYCPAGYVHGIVRFYLNGYGWCRMDVTSGVGKLPLVQKPNDRGLIRLYDMPIEMEKIDYAYAWPYEHNTIDGRYLFYSGGEVVRTVRFAARDEAEARQEGRVSGRVSKPFPHLEPGSWNTVLVIEPWEVEDAEWAGLAAASREAILTDQTGIFPAVARLLATRAGRAWIQQQLRQLKQYGDLPGGT